MKNLWQFIKFGLVGVSNTLISEGLYAILVFFDVHYLLAYFVGFVLSVLNAYYWSNKYVFKLEEGEHRVAWKVLAKTYVAYLGGFLLSSALLVLWIDIVDLSRFMGTLAESFKGLGLERVDADFLGEVIAAGINLLITVPLNYAANKFWAYKKEKNRENH